MAATTTEHATPYGTFTTADEPEPHTLHNVGPAGIAIVYDVRRGTERPLPVPAGKPGEPATVNLASSDEVFVGWLSRET